MEYYNKVSKNFIFIFFILNLASCQNENIVNPNNSDSSKKFMFDFPMEIGKSWEYKYSSGWVWRGIHVWKVIDYDVNGDAIIMDIRRDTSQSQIINDTLTFRIINNSEYYLIEFPEWIGGQDSLRKLNKYMGTEQDTLHVEQSICGGVCRTQKITYVNHIGITKYSGIEPSMHAGETVLELINSD